MHGRDAEALVERWLRGRGYAPERFPLRRRKLGKTPDFRVNAGAREAFLVEVKTLHNALPSHGAVAFKLGRARAQFDAVNNGGRLANVLVLVTRAPEAVARLLGDLAGSPASPLDAVDAVIGFPTDGLPPSLLHATAGTRHTSLIAQLRAGTDLALRATA